MGVYRGTKLGAKDESAMDNSPVHDTATLDRATGLLDSHDVGLNALLALEGEMLVGLLAGQGRLAEAAAIASRTTALKQAIRTSLWDPSRQVFANRLLDGRFVDSLAPTSFYPMIAGIPTPEQVKGLLVQLHDPNGFAGAFRLPSVRRDDPAFGDGVYWRGRVWPPMNWLTWAGLRRMGQEDEAAALAVESHALFRGPWEAERQAAENFSADTGATTDQPDTDTFYAWSALMPAMAVAEVLDVTPWDGFTLTNGANTDIGPVATPCGPCSVVVSEGVLRLIRQGVVLLETDIPGRLRHVQMGDDRIRLTLPRDAPAGTLSMAIPAPFLARQGNVTLETKIENARLTVKTCAATSELLRAIDVILA